MPRSAAPARTAVTLSKAMHRDIAAYALAAGAAGVSALALAQSAEAEIVYTPAHQLIRRNERFSIDANHDGINDVAIENRFHVGTFRGLPYSTSFQLRAVPAPGAGVLTGNTSYKARALPRGATIGPSQAGRFKWGVMASQFYRASAGTYYWGSWVNVSNRYLGFVFKIGEERHYGWARLNVKQNGKWRIVAELTGYAYETDANKPIIAGDTGGAAGDQANSGPTGEMFSEPVLESKPPAMLGSLALGSGGLSIWRREE